LHSRDK